MSNSESKCVVVSCRFAIRSYLFERNGEVKKKNIPNWQEIVPLVTKPTSHLFNIQSYATCHWHKKL